MARKKPSNNKVIVHPVILCGGAGTRLWPVSRADLPKQFLAMVTQRTMLQDTALLVGDRSCYAAPTYLTGEDFRFLVEHQIKEIKQDASLVIMEPVRRNTAPAIALAALSLAQHDPDALMLVMPSDHVLESKSRFHACVAEAVIAAQRGYLVTFGMKAIRPETGFGYIHEGPPLRGVEQGYKVQNFVEKPNRETAQAYIDDGSYHWNSGMFLFKASRYLTELEQHHPGIVDACKTAIERGRRGGGMMCPEANHLPWQKTSRLIMR